MATPKNTSVIKAFEILNVFSRNNGALTAPEVAKATGLNLSTTHRFLLTLENLGAVARSPGNRYHLGMMVAELGKKVTKRDVFAERASGHVKKLCDRLDETISLATFEDERIQFVAWAEPKRPLFFHLRRDEPLPLHASSLGKIFLAALPTVAREEMISKLVFTKLTQNTLDNAVSFRRELQEVSKAGFARDSQELEEGLDCVAMPILDTDGNVFAALSVSAPSSRISRSVLSQIKEALSSTVSDIQKALFIENKILPGKAKPKGSFPHVKRVGDFAFISGTSARNPDESFAGATVRRNGEVVLDITKQTSATIQNIADILASIGAELSHLVELEAYLVDMNDYDAFNAAYEQFFGADGPTRTTVSVEALPHPHQLIMVKATAYIPS
ncbi:IclR family transcriptional regulator C-terminal domain-containing protein [Phaeobacter sp. 11ANDIMAR09]|uniref:IclR family transcriptional regulator domain-containing protein n=1 Tax=Phaeobacter sp. 11ANDIMAR09 TaxID=1225647 RepID=UPI0009FB2D61|nr:IclR family transcriptional regulator C-terminal domain-containing protein [Phaeobacter sp. 11ANDIMAR09]